ncbi:MAG: TonB-dependent receptor [Woeseiaceae bacterium]|nr:TonB-dependent receptor [Woeseiaceae bacterium]
MMKIATLVALLPCIAWADDSDTIDEIVVTSTRTSSSLASHPGNIDVLDRTEIEAANHAHIHELLTRVAGVWVTRGSGQESLPSIRSPVLTGAGSCGAFLTLEDGIPSRPSGFCNVNQLFELPTELAERIEVIRGPGNALYGSNALHGTISVLLPEAAGANAAQGSLEVGSDDFISVEGFARNADGTPVVVGGTATHDGGFRSDSGFRQLKGFAKASWTPGEDTVTATLSISDLDQETAGFIVGQDAYADPALNRQNLNPEAFRKADSQRLGLRWSFERGDYDVDIRPYVRRSRMDFLQHFLPGKPLEENGHVSLGVLTSARKETDRLTTIVGLDLDLADVYLRQTQDGPAEGSDFLRETRPEGQHYDYDVTAVDVALYTQLEYRLSERTIISAGLRAEHARYDYRNNLATGNLRDDGTACGFGGCLYSRPADREDHFTDLAPKLGVVFRLTDDTSVYVNAARGFRAPQMTELYRLQSGQLVSDIDSETIDSLELGWRGTGVNWRLDTAAFAMRKRDSVYRDANGFNVSGARSRHAGLEFAAQLRLHEHWTITLNGTYARHTYDFDVVAARGEAFVSGRDVDTAPRWQGSAELRYAGDGRVDASLQWVSLGRYYLDAENLFDYPGHDLANLRVAYALSQSWTLVARVNNLADVSYADRADYAFGNYRYFPGRGRQTFLQLRYSRD